MSNDDIAAAVLECVGGFSNVSGNSLCATRLRISLRDPAGVDRNALHSINGVLGIADRGKTGIEVVFGPNLVKGVYYAFERLTGLLSDDHAATEPAYRSGNFQVKITPETPGRPQVQSVVSRPSVEVAPVTDDDTNALLEMLQDDSDADTDFFEAEDEGPRLLVVNGPNINLLGLRDDGPLGLGDYARLLELCHESAREAGFSECECYQSNHEGDLIDCVQDAYGAFDAIVINPGAYSHTSIALFDALKAVGIPAIDVRLCNISALDEFRQNSYVAEACLKTIMGEGMQGYRHAIFDLARHIGITE